MKGGLRNEGGDCRRERRGMRNKFGYRITPRLKAKLRPYLIEDIVELRPNNGVLRCRAQKRRCLKGDIGMDDCRLLVRTDVKDSDITGIPRTRGGPKAAQDDLVTIANHLARYLWQGRLERAKDYLGVRGLNCLCRLKSHRSVSFIPYRRSLSTVKLKSPSTASRKWH